MGDGHNTIYGSPPRNVIAESGLNSRFHSSGSTVPSHSGNAAKVLSI